MNITIRRQPFHDPAGVNWVVENSPDRSGGKKPGLGHQITLPRRKLVAVAGPEFLDVETGSHLGKGG